MKKALYYILVTLFILAWIFFTGCGWFATVAWLWAILSNNNMGYWIEYALLIFGIPWLIVWTSIFYTIYLIWKKKTNLFLKIFWWFCIVFGVITIIYAFINIAVFFDVLSRGFWEVLQIFLFSIMYTVVWFIVPVVIWNYILNCAWVRVKIIDSIFKIVQKLESVEKIEKDDVVEIINTKL
jgi:hypothetical protein